MVNRHTKLPIHHFCESYTQITSKNQRSHNVLRLLQCILSIKQFLLLSLLLALITSLSKPLYLYCLCFDNTENTQVMTSQSGNIVDADEERATDLENQLAFKGKGSFCTAACAASFAAPIAVVAAPPVAAPPAAPPSGTPLLPPSFGLPEQVVPPWLPLMGTQQEKNRFEKATVDISSDSASVSLIIPLIAMINSKLSIKEQDSEKIKQLKIDLCESLNRRFSYTKSTMELLIATLIDPRFKTKYLTTDEVETAKTEVISFLCQSNIHTESQSRQIVNMDVDIQEEEPGPSRSTEPGICNNSSNGNLWDTHDKMAIKGTNTGNVDGDSGNICHELEAHLSHYLREPLLLRNADVYEYWASCPHIRLRPIALKYLSAPPTSVPSEQFFSAAGQILYEDRRSNLKGENVDKLLFLAYNIRLFNFDY
nr:unnamed protein product [Callosobruchus chinensis]